MAVNGIEITLGSKWVSQDDDTATVIDYHPGRHYCWTVQCESKGVVTHTYDVNDNGCADSRRVTAGDLVVLVDAQPAIQGVQVLEIGMSIPGYEKLADVLQLAYNQAAVGKGVERHAAGGEPFHEQVMQIGAAKFGVGALLFQAFKKSEESQRLDYERGIAELLGAIIYLAGAVIAMDIKRGDK